MWAEHNISRIRVQQDLLSHYLKTQDEWEAYRQAAKCQVSGDDRGFVCWTFRAALCEQVREIERRAKERKTGIKSLFESGAIPRKIEAKFRREARETDLKSLEMFASGGIPRAQEVLAKLNKKK